MKSVVVLGGSGFVGRAICREARRRGWRVTSLTRHGAPPSAHQDSLLHQVEWRTGNALDASLYPALLAGQDFLVHSIGTLFETNPLYALYNPQPVEYASSYPALIRDTTAVAAEAAGRMGIKGLGYLSAARYGALGTALLPKYMQMKEEAEALLKAQHALSTVIARPGFMYGTDRWATLPLAVGVSALSLFTAGLFPRALSVDTVARALLNQLDILADAHPHPPSPPTSLTLEVGDLCRAGSQ